jgi:hypothetical protein
MLFAAICTIACTVDGMDGSCAHRRRNAPYCSCQKLLSRGATQCKLQQ